MVNQLVSADNATVRETAILLAYYFYEMPGQDLNEAAKLCGLDKLELDVGMRVVTLASDVFAYIIDNREQLLLREPLSSPAFHHRACLLAANLLADGWTP